MPILKILLKLNRNLADKVNKEKLSLRWGFYPIWSLVDIIQGLNDAPWKDRSSPRPSWSGGERSFCQLLKFRREKSKEKPMKWTCFSKLKHRGFRWRVCSTWTETACRGGSLDSMFKIKVLRKKCNTYIMALLPILRCETWANYHQSCLANFSVNVLLY